MTGTEGTSDAAVREAIRRETGRSVVVEASAGTGKTTLLTDRVVAMVSEGTPLESVAVVTFTEAAASELRVRIREKLPEELRRGMDQAWIHTIHGFASRILREYYHLCGGIPVFSTEAGHFSEAELGMLWDLFMSSRDREDLEASSEGFRSMGSSTLLRAAGALEEHRWVCDPALASGALTELQRLIEYWRKNLDSISSRCTDDSDKLLKGILKAMGELTAGNLEVDLNLRQGSHAAWNGRECLAEVKDELKTFKADIGIMKGLESFAALEPSLEKLVFPFLNHVRGIWDSDPSRLSFHDLLYMARTAVEKSARLREELSARFSHVLIDEFQDTSFLQVQLFRSILDRGGLSGKLTVVGDPKQSIYGWRSADIETYTDTVTELEESGALSGTIVVNFRSCKPVIDFVNSFGGSLFAQALPGETPFAARYSPILPAPSAVEGQGVFVHRLPKISGASAGIHAVLQGERIAEIIDEPGATAILFRSRTHMEEVLSALDGAGIPYRMDAGADFTGRDEIRDAAVMLRCVLDPGDSGALTDTLRSMFFGIDDRAISVWRHQGIRSAGIDKALGIIEELRGRSRILPPGIFLRHLFRSTCILSSIRDSGYETRRRLANIRCLVERAEASESLSMLLDVIEGTAPVSAEEPVSIPEGPTDAVTVTTIHRAKGLAWDHVIVANPGGTFRRNTGPVLADPRRNRLGLKLGSAVSAHYAELADREHFRMVAEFRRLMYVAVTRPRKRLDIILEPPGGSIGASKIVHDALAASSGFTLLDIGPEPAGRREVLESGVPYRSEGEPFTELFTVSFPDGDSERSRGMRLGTEVHSILEKISMDDPSIWIGENLEALRAALEFPEEAIELALRFFELYDLSGARILGREYPLLNDGEFYYVDLLLSRKGHLVAVDYKTDSGEIEERTAFYRPHQKLYASLLEKALGQPVRSILVFLRHGEIREIS